MTARVGRRRGSVAALLTGGLCMTAGGIGMWTGSARAAISFAATGSAYGVRSSSTGAAFPLGAAPEGASPVAQAVVDSLGTSRGFASSPYPGDFFIGNYGLVAGLTNQPVPPYPLIVASDAATDPEPAPASAPGYSLSSKSDPDSSKANANQGAASSGNQGAYAEANAAAKRHDDGSVEVQSSSLSSGFTAAGVLTFGTVTTVATAAVDASGNLTTHTDLQVTGATLGGQTVGFANGQFVLPGTTQPVPDSSALAQAGVKVALVGEQKLPDGVESPGIEVTITQHAAAGSPADGDYTTTYVLGRSIATIDHSGAADSDQPAAVDSGSGSVSGTTPEAPAPASDAGGSGTAALPAAATSSSASPAAPAAASSPSASASAAPAPRSTPRPPGTRNAARVALASSARDGDAGTIYLVLVLAGVLLVAATGVVRYVGVRSPWTS